MTDEKTATRALTGNRQLVQNQSQLFATWNPATAEYDAETNSQSWIKGGPNFHYLESYFDTSGYTRDMLTIMPITAYVQEAGRYQVTEPGTQRLIVVDLITTERISNAAAFVGDLITGNEMIGFPNSTVDFTQVIFGRMREFTGITQGGSTQDVFAPTSDQQFGSLEPTTSDKLWTYKFIINIGLPSSPQLANYLRYPGSRIILQVEVIKESELPFMMRQKRSYELSNY